MKKLKFTLITACFLFFLSSCYTYKFQVGEGAQTGSTVTEKNHYFIFGLAQGKQSDPNIMANGAADYDVQIQHTFVDGLINTLTFGLYNPTTTTVWR